MEFKEIVMKRYATGKFDGKIIPDEKINQLFEIIRNAPSPFNIQPWKIIVVKDQATKEKLAPVSWNQPQITTCSHLLVFCADTNLLERFTKFEDLLIGMGAKKEDLKGYFDMTEGFIKGLPEERKLPWSQRQVYLALGNAVNGAKSLGFDSCPMEGFNPEEYSKILKLPKNIVPTALCTIGYAADTPRPKARLPRNEIFVE